MARMLPLWLAGLISAAVLWWLFAALLHPAGGDAGARIGVAAAALLPTALLLLAMVQAQMAVRARSGAVDPTAGVDNAFLRLNQRAISNTVEQTVAFAPALFALAARVAPDSLARVIALPLVFAAARLVFWLGYLVGPRWRAPGMTATFMVNVVTWIAAAWAWLG